MESGAVLVALAAAFAAGAGIAWSLLRRRRPSAGAEDRYLPVFKTSPGALALTRMSDGTFAAVNDGFLELMALEERDVVGKSPLALGLWQDPEQRRRIVEAVERGEVVKEAEVLARTARGELKRVAFSATRVEVGGVAHLLTFARDVTAERAAGAERDRLQDEVRRAEERSRAILRSVPVVQWALDREGVFTLSEGEGLAALGLRPGQVVGRRIEDVYRDLPEVVTDFRRALAGETFVKENDFKVVVFESHWGPLRDASGAVVGVTGIALDVTPRKVAERARREGELKVQLLERLATMGRAAAGLAHEVNNPLTYVLGNLDAALERLPEGERGGDLRELVADARAGADRVRQIVNDLRVFASAKPRADGASEVEAVVRSAVAFTRNDIRHRARLVTELEPGCRVAMPEGRLAQVLVNLLANACNALPEGHAAENTITLRARRVGRRVELEVSDTGAGIPPEVRARLFEPFFTTRADGGGMGLGLALTRAMLVEAGGDVALDGAPGRGTTFRIDLPAAEEVAPSPPPAAVAGAPARVLVVDDEPLVARAVARILSGHQVQTTTAAREALARLRGGEPFDVVICDLMMPDLTGMDLHDALLAERPEYADRFLLLTGGAFTDRARDFLARTRARVLEKPVDAGALRTAVAEVAARAGATRA